MFDKKYKLHEDDLIYHYCSAETFNAICNSKKIRLCDIFTMNDYLEMHWGYSIWEKAANELIDDLGFEFIDEIDTLIHLSGLKWLILISCFSKDGDVLSQWRGYADNGNGYVIGFKAVDFYKMNVEPIIIEYDEKIQLEKMKSIILDIYKKENKSGEEFIKMCDLIAYNLSKFKNPMFKEENEIRLIHQINFIKSNSFLKLEDSGGTYFGKNIGKQDIKFLMSNNIPKAYIEIDFTNNGEVNPIKEVIIGPKNDVQITAISVYLETLGIGNVNVKRSKCSYR